MGEIAPVGVEDSLGWELDTPSSSSTVNNGGSKKLPQLSLNHVSFLCKSVARSVRFYEEVLGFVLIKRPSSFTFEGAWLFNHGIGIHLLEKDDLSSKKGRINPKDNHISFQTSDMGMIMQKLDGMGIEYVTAVVEEGGVIVDQLFFHDPDGYMIEICNCQNLPVLPLSSCPIKKLPTPNTHTNITPSSFYGKVRSKMMCSGEVEALMMENLAVDMMDISF
ncbi:Metallothiol transferase [Actinidia chinensis var. chinensis]|uniref:Lactoylglutathione lyase n=2 Tax=Actinidia TaxID=3624 RepID=A0A7J0ES59_9ERIC|nr:Metallothiol transferase [Actinidia chinensis var. chinensis]GFY89308.1 lactoylglutathione lyase [Actinidia rufa]